MVYSKQDEPHFSVLVQFVYSESLVSGFQGEELYSSLMSDLFLLSLLLDNDVDYV